MRYFITGATGFIGGRVARMLREAGHEVVTLARDPAKAGDLTALGVQVAKGDIADRATLRDPMTGVDGVFHIAALYKLGAKYQKDMYRINVEGTRNVLETMRDLGISKGVYTSTLAVNGDTDGRVVDESYRHTGTFLSEYDKTKWQAHYEVAEPMMRQGLPLVIVMPGVVYGPGDTSSVRQTFIDYLQGRLPLVPQRTAFAWAHVDDIARGHILAMERGTPGSTYIIAGEVMPMTDALALAEKITGVSAPRLQAAPGMMRAMAGLMGLVERFAAVPDSFSAEGLRATAGVTYVGSNAKARAELGYTPRPLADGLRETLEHEMKLLGMERKKA